jgi:hypothetical protein
MDIDRRNLTFFSDEKIIDDRTKTASGSTTLAMLVEMLVERVFLVSGVVKTVFCLSKQKKNIFFFTTNKRKYSRTSW